jgi:23S rRNA (uracil1939-C5)-methyltransferase
MIARHAGQVVLVSGAIPGERVEARIERVQRQVAWAATEAVLEASPDRVPVAAGLTCGGQVLAHVADARQRALKGEMLADALRRVGRLPLADVPSVRGGPADGYRIRARIHLRGGRAGFYDEGTHRLCDVAGSRQLTPASVGVLAGLTAALAGEGGGVEAEIEWAEDVPGTRRIAHLAVAPGTRPALLDHLRPVAGLDACSWAPVDTGRDSARTIWGTPELVDHLRAGDGAPVAIVHGARAFFQGNRFLLQALVDEVAGRLRGPVVDLYAGVGPFARVAAARGHAVTAVEGDAVSAADLARTLAGVAAASWRHEAIERHLQGPPSGAGTVVVDPPRTGLSAEVTAGLLRWLPPRVVYVSCDPATLARDLRRLVDGGYGLGEVRGFDLFPRTGHVEAVVTLER